MPDTILQVKNLSVQFHGEKILSDVNFEVKRRDIMAILGPNGAGKTVLFHALLGFIPYEGQVLWQEGIKIGYVPQRFFIDREMPLSVGEFLELKKAGRYDLHEILRLVGLSLKINGKDILEKRLGILSSGQIQRVLVAWALLGNPDVLFFDEPTTGIDIGGEETIYNLLHQLHIERDITIVLISHDLNVVYKHANKVLCLNKKMLCFGFPQEVLDPKALIRLYGQEASFYKHGHQ